LTSQQRGNKTGLVGASITINPGTACVTGTSSGRDEAPDVDDPEYSLKQETTEFLTQLSQSLSDENDNLIGLVRSTLVTLKELQGISDGQKHGNEEGLSVIGEEEESSQQGMLHALPTSYETLASDMDTVLENLKTLLTNPNFVSVEEVELREEEIVRLRAGWERLETRWRDALGLMEGWRRRMANGGDTINLEELRMGMGLGVGLETMNKEEVSIITEEDEEGASSEFDENVDEEEDLVNLPSPEVDDVPEKTSGSDMFKLKLQPDPPPALREGHGNKSTRRTASLQDASPAYVIPQNTDYTVHNKVGGRPLERSPRKVAFSASIPNTPSEVMDENVGGSQNGFTKPVRPPSSSKTHTADERASRSSDRDSRIPRNVRCDKIADQVIRLASKVTFSSSPSMPESTTDLYIDDDQAKKRLSSPHAHPEEPSPKLTVQDKLKAAQVEAEAAAVAEGLRSVKAERADDAEQRRRRRSSPMKTKIGGRPKRRKSTLTPEELQNLIGFD
jgi:hypothetical protein